MRDNIERDAMGIHMSVQLFEKVKQFCMENRMTIGQFAEAAFAEKLRQERTPSRPVSNEYNMTLSHVSKMLHVPKAQVKAWADKGELKSTLTPGGHRRYRQSDVVAFAKKHKISIREDR